MWVEVGVDCSVDVFGVGYVFFDYLCGFVYCECLDVWYDIVGCWFVDYWFFVYVFEQCCEFVDDGLIGCFVVVDFDEWYQQCWVQLVCVQYLCWVCDVVL